MFPGVSINVESGNLQGQVSVLDGVPALVATASTAGLIGAVKLIYSLADAISKGFTLAAEPFIYGLLQVYYNELGGNQLIYVMGVAETATMTDVVTSTNASGLIKLLQAQTSVNLVAVARKPVAGYNAGAAFLDSDVAAAVTASKTLLAARQVANMPVRLFIEGRVANENTANAYSPNTATNGFASVVLGGTTANGSAAVTLALARAVKYGAHVKLGSGQNGALSVQNIYVGTKSIDERLDMTTLHDAGFLTFHKRAGLSGYYFGRDNMCAADDFNILVHGRVIDKAQRIAAIASAPYIEDYIRMNADGTINDTDANDLETVIKSAIRSKMSEQISGVQVKIDTNQDLINTSTLAISVSVLPLGYLTWITITLGLTASITA
jgi:hypothetical protein